jgi:hypothetical protein
MDNNIEYEKLTREIYQHLLEEEGLTVEVKHNVKIKGKSTKNQIDVYWEYSLAGVKHKVAIECKNYNRRISKNIITSFNSVLTDIGNTNGIIVTKIGFQKGAKEFGDYHGINLIELREPRPEDWKGRFKVIETHVKAIAFDVKKWFVELDYDWCKARIPQDKLNSIEVVISGMNYDIWIYQEDGKELKNFKQLQDELPFDENSLVDNKHTFKFDNGYINSENFGLVKIIGVHLRYDTIINKAVWIDDSEKITQAILKNVTTGEMKFIKKG